MFSFTIANWSLWLPQMEQAAQQSDNPAAESVADIVADLATDRVDRTTAPNVKDLPMMLRRRLSRYGRMAMRVAVDVGVGDQAQLVFCSRYGDAAQTTTLLTDLAREEAVSPAVFSMLVHNALAGLFCIHTKNRRPHTAIAAAEESFCAGLLEAALLLNEDPSTPVLLVYCDEPLPEIYGAQGGMEAPSIALAMVLTGFPGDCSQQNFGFTVADGSAKPELSLAETTDQDDPVISFAKFLNQAEGSWSWSFGRKTWWCDFNVD